MHALELCGVYLYPKYMPWTRKKDVSDDDLPTLLGQLEPQGSS